MVPDYCAVSKQKRYRQHIAYLIEPHVVPPANNIHTFVILPENIAHTQVLTLVNNAYTQVFLPTNYAHINVLPPAKKSAFKRVLINQIEPNLFN